MGAKRTLGVLADYRKLSTEDDVKFVYDAWLNSWRKSRYAGVIPNHLYYDTMRETIDGLRARGAVVIIAEYKGELLGFACAEEKDGKVVLHYLYVKDAFMNKGVEVGLLAHLPGQTPGWFTFAQQAFLKDKEWTHAPEMARRLKL